jgi:hypothetical protein
MNKTMTVAALCLLAGPASADPPKPIGPSPQPAIGAACPSGYQRSGGACVPGPHASCRAFPNVGATCPSGYTTSFDYCVETGCQ